MRKRNQKNEKVENKNIKLNKTKIKTITFVFS